MEDWIYKSAAANLLIPATKYSLMPYFSFLFLYSRGGKLRDGIDTDKLDKYLFSVNG